MKLAKRTLSFLTAATAMLLVYATRRRRGGVSHHFANWKGLGASTGAWLPQLCRGQWRTNLVAATARNPARSCRTGDRLWQGMGLLQKVP